MLQAILVSTQTDWQIFLRKLLERTYASVQVVTPQTVQQHLLNLAFLPDLIVLDIDSDDICNTSLLDWFWEKRQFAASRLIVISANPTSGQRECARRIGASAFILKPFTYQEFEAMLEPISL